MKRFISLTIAILFASSYLTALVPVSVAEAAEVNTSDSIVLDSSASENMAYHMRYQWFTGYPRDNNGDGDTKDTGEAGDWWPTRTEGCTTNTTTNYKIFPWLPENDDLNNPSFSYDGNTLTTSGNCYDRYRDGGTSRGVWVPAYYGGGWVLDSFTPSSLWGSSVATVSGDTIFSDELFASRVSSTSNTIWAKKTWETEEHSVALAKRMGYSTYSLSDGWGVYSSGTTLFRNEFNITDAQYAKLGNASSTAFLGAVADDWMKVYVNGLPIAEAETVETITKVSNHDLKNNGSLQDVFHVGKNVVTFQVSDKARWGKKVTSSNKAGLNYKLTITLASETTVLGCTDPDATNYNANATQDDGSCVIPDNFTCDVNPATGTAPLVVVFDMSGTAGSNYTINTDDTDASGAAVVLSRIFTSSGAEEVYYTYTKAGTYEPTASSGTYVNIPCGGPSITVTDPDGTTGGEVSP